MLDKSFNSLIERASKEDNYKHIKKPEVLRKTAKTLYKYSQNDPLDIEKTFVFLYRFLKVYQQLLKVSRDQKFEKLMLEKEVENAESQINKLKEVLTEMYQKHSSVPTVSGMNDNGKNETLFPMYLNKLFITCDEMYRALKQDKLNLLGIDIRSSSDFIISSLTCFPCINIPEDNIHLGMSAHVLTQRIVNEYLNLWEERDKFDCIVIIDAAITPDTYEASKAHQLRVIMTEWDPARSYRVGPVILEGGYKEFADRYPTYCKNVHLLLNQYNDDLEDILDLERVDYPTENDIQRMKQERAGTDDEISPDTIKTIIEENRKVLEKNKQLQEQLLVAEKNLADLDRKLEIESNKNVASNILNEKMKEENRLKALYNLEINLKKERDHLVNPFTINKTIPMENLAEIAKLEKDVDKHMEMRSKVYEEERKRRLQQARQIPKPGYLNFSKIVENASINVTKSKPLIDRSTKPITWWKGIQNLIPEGTSDKPYGIIGLKNIRNTCYMNSAIQCLRHLEIIVKYVLEGLFTEDLHENAVIMPQFASLLFEMWHKTGVYMEPSEFYNTFKKIAPVYGQGRHEDISEFLLLLINYLHEDISFELNMKDYNTSIKRAWYESQGGTSSYIIETFYHEMQVNQPCQNCGDVGYKYEVDNVFYLEVPSRDFTIEEQLKQQLAPQFVEGYVCKKCQSPRVKVVKSICHNPAVAVFVLKRWLGSGDNTSVNHSRCIITVDNLVVGKVRYNLTGIALHTGSVNSGHYTAVCQNPVNKRWYEFNDESVTEVDINSPNFGTKAYMLFYSYKFDNTRSVIDCPFFTNYDKIKHRKKRKIEN